MQYDLQKEASRDVNIGQLMDASDSPPHPFNSSWTMDGASMWSALNLGQIPKFNDRSPTYNKNENFQEG